MLGAAGVFVAVALAVCIARLRCPTSHAHAAGDDARSSRFDRQPYQGMAPRSTEVGAAPRSYGRQPYQGQPPTNIDSGATRDYAAQPFQGHVQPPATSASLGREYGRQPFGPTPSTTAADSRGLGQQAPRSTTTRDGTVGVRRPDLPPVVLRRGGLPAPRPVLSSPRAAGLRVRASPMVPGRVRTPNPSPAVPPTPPPSGSG